MSKQLTKQEIEKRVDWLSTLMHPEEALWYCLNPDIYGEQRMAQHRAYVMPLRRKFRAAEAAVATRIGAMLGPLREFDDECQEVVEALRLPEEFQAGHGEYHDGALAYALGISDEWIAEQYGEEG
jgi:hypothetical protein